MLFLLLRRSSSALLTRTTAKRWYSVDIADSFPIQNITVFGGGLMGAGIAQVAAYSGFQVTLCDSTEKALENGRAIIQQSIARIAKAAHPDEKSAQNSLVSSVFDRITSTIDPAKAVASANLIVEAIVEDMKVKQDLFRLLDLKAPSDCIFATNTNSLSVSDIALPISKERKTRFGGLHFFNPVPQMRLVEVVRTDALSSDAFQILLHVCKRLDKTAVVCRDVPGFIVNRLLIPYMIEAIRMLERGDATADDIDTAMKLGAGYPMGPIELADYVGLDTMKHILEDWQRKSASGAASLPPDLVRESPLLNEKVKGGKMGRKSGEGFMKY